MKEVHIIGQGLAGTMLSMRLEEAGQAFKVIDQAHHSSSSRIAAGLANPVVLKRQKWVADAEQYLAEAPSFYRDWEQKLQSQFFHPVRLEHIFHNAGEINDWQANSEKPLLSNHLGAIINDEIPFIDQKHGRAQVEGIFWLDTVAFIEARKNDLRQKGLLVEEDYQNYQAPDNAIQVFCNGHFLRISHPNMAHAFSPTKGEVMIIKAPNLPEDRILHAGVFTLPLGNQTFKVGATYSHHDLSENTSQEGLDFLKQKLEVFYKGPYEVLEQKAGVRPNIKDRKPLLGRISESEYVFNGFGSRGVLMGPYLSKHFCEYLLEDKALNPHWDLQRFISI